jgi:hypothetical protein
MLYIKLPRVGAFFITLQLDSALSHLINESTHNYPSVHSIFSNNKMQISKVLAVSMVVTTSIAGPVTYSICQAGCAGVVMACYAAAGFVWGATAGAAAPATVLACNAAFGQCQSACWLATLLGP